MKYQHGLQYVYPEDIHGHMIAPPQVRDEKLDQNFKFYDKSKRLRFIQHLLHFAMVIIAFPVTAIRYGLKIKGKKKLRQFRKHYKGGFLTVCNHVFDWDYLCVRSAISPRRGYVTVWKNNHNSKLGKLMRAVGSIPVPDRNNIDGLCSFNKAIVEALEDNRIVHFYPEGSMWYFYQDLREFLPGAFHYAVIANKPVVPLAIAFRPAKGIFKLWKRHGAPCVTIEIGDPIYPNQSLSNQDAIKDLSSRAFDQMKAIMNKNTPEV